jgi:hypothetical protein
MQLPVIRILDVEIIEWSHRSLTVTAQYGAVRA